MGRAGPRHGAGPGLLFIDEPTSGLDPIGAAFDSLIRDLQQSLNLTVLMVTHDLDSLTALCQEQFFVRAEGAR